MVVVMVVVVMVAVTMLAHMIMGVFAALESQRSQQRPALHPQKTQTDQQNERVTDDLDHPHGIAHSLRRDAKEGSGNRDDGDGGHRLQNGGCKREHDAAPPGLVVGHQIRRDDRFAVARSRRMKDAIEK